MLFTIDLDTLELIESATDRRRVTMVESKRGDGMPVTIAFLSGGVQGPLEASTVITFGAKEQGAYAEDAVVLLEGFSVSGTEATTVYQGSPSLNTLPLNRLLVDGVIGEIVADDSARYALTGKAVGYIVEQTDTGKFWRVIDAGELDNAAGWELAPQKSFVDLVAEVTWLQPSDDAPQTTRSFTLRINNDVVRGDEGTPLSLPTPEEWLAANVNNAIATDPAATRTAAIAAYAHADERLWNYRDRLAATSAKQRIAIIGDSMVNLSWSQGLKDGLVAAFGDGGLGFAFGAASAGATLVQNDCTKWISGNYWTVPLNGEVMFHGGGASIAIPATALRIYYVKQPGGGHFKVQYERNSGSWTDVPTLTDIDTDDTLGGAVATYDLTAVSTALANYRIKVVGLGDGAGGAATADPIIIGGALVNSLSDGAELSLIANNSSSSPSNNIDAASATPTAITDPIFAALSPSLILLSNYDGATMNQTYLPTFMDNVDQGIATGSGSPVASWVLIGPPPGESAETDAQLASQAAVMRSIAKERGQSFFDNREWAGGYAAAESAGLMVSGDVHYQALAVKQWVPMMIHSLGLDRATKFGASNVGQLRFAKGAIIEDAPTTSSYYPVARLLGALDISNHPGETNRGYIRFLDSNTPANESDFAQVNYFDNRWTWNLANGATVVKMGPGTGIGFELYDNASNTSTPRGVLGTSAQPLRRIHLGKAEAGATGDVTTSFGCGTVKFAAGSSTPIVVTHSGATATSVIHATVYGTDATLTSVRVTRAAGSFTITPDAAATAETTVGWVIFP